MWGLCQLSLPELLTLPRLELSLLGDDWLSLSGLPHADSASSPLPLRFPKVMRAFRM